MHESEGERGAGGGLLQLGGGGRLGLWWVKDETNSPPTLYMQIIACPGPAVLAITVAKPSSVPVRLDPQPIMDKKRVSCRKWSARPCS